MCLSPFQAQSFLLDDKYIAHAALNTDSPITDLNLPVFGSELGSTYRIEHFLFQIESELNGNAVIPLYKK